ncbi:MAG: regulatory protein RecX [Microbacterium sp.]
MTGIDGGEDDRLAPVIPLFGGTRPGTGDRSADRDDEPAAIPRRTGATGLWRSTWDGEVDGTAGPSERHPAYGARGRLRAVGAQKVDGAQGELVDGPQAGEDATDPEELRARAEETLVRKLRTRSLSVSEARAVLRDVGLPREQIDDVIDEFEQRRYLDDAVLAGLLVTAGVERKGQGRVALGRALAQRGLPREVIDAALAELPDDDAERALEFARSRASSMVRLDPETAVRRLVGQLSRRGYSGAIAMDAARRALREASGGGARGVRFE